MELYIMLEKILKFLILLAIMVAIPVLWWQSLQTYKGFKPILLSTGASMFLFGLCYKLMGTWDLIPDWIPLLGSLDDSAAWMIMLLGAVVGGTGYFLL